MVLDLDGALPFIDVLTNRRCNGSLEHSVYRKLHTLIGTCPSTLLFDSGAQSHRFLGRSSFQRIIAMYEHNSLSRELYHVTEALIKNDYPRHQI